MIACVHHAKSQANCERCVMGDSVLPTICQNHLSMTICIGNDAKSVQAFENSMTKLDENVYGMKTNIELKSLPRKSSRVNNVSYICTLGEGALVPARDEAIKEAIRGLLSLTRNIFTSRVGEWGFSRLVDHMQQVPVMYPNAYTDLCRARKLPTAKIYFDSSQYLVSTSPSAADDVLSDRADIVQMEDEPGSSEDESIQVSLDEQLSSIFMNKFTEAERAGNLFDVEVGSSFASAMYSGEIYEICASSSSGLEADTRPTKRSRKLDDE